MRLRAQEHRCGTARSASLKDHDRPAAEYEGTAHLNRLVYFVSIRHRLLLMTRFVHAYWRLSFIYSAGTAGFVSLRRQGRSALSGGCQFVMVHGSRRPRQPRLPASCSARHPPLWFAPHGCLRCLTLKGIAIMSSDGQYSAFSIVFGIHCHQSILISSIFFKSFSPEFDPCPSHRA